MPRPRQGEVLVRVSACGVCHTDLHVMKGEVAFPTPAVLGHEISGTVVACGPGVDSPAVGRARCRDVRHALRHLSFLPAGRRDDLCERFFAMNRLRGTLYDGETRLAPATMEHPSRCTRWAAWPSTAVVPATAVFPLTDGVALEQSAVLGCAAMTAFGAIRHGGELRGGERIAVVGVGGVGSLVVKLCASARCLAGRSPSISATRSSRPRGALGRHRCRERAPDATPSQRSCSTRAEAASMSPSRSWDGSRPSPRRWECSATAAGWSPSESPRRACTAPVEITRLVRRGLRDRRVVRRPGRARRHADPARAHRKRRPPSGDGDHAYAFTLAVRG